MKKLLIFIMVGVLFGITGEYLASIIIKENINNFLFTLIFNPLYLLFVYLSSKIIYFLFKNKLTAEVIYYFAYSFTGLMIEWFLCGNSPRGNPNAIQWGMFSYWATMTMTARIFTDETIDLSGLKKWILLFFIPYSFLSVMTGYLLPTYVMKMVVLVWLMVLGYTFMNIFYISYFIKIAKHRSEKNIK